MKGFARSGYRVAFDGAGDLQLRADYNNTRTTIVGSVATPPQLADSRRSCSIASSSGGSNAVNSFNGIQTFPSQSPFGMNGRSPYARIARACCEAGKARLSKRRPATMIGKKGWDCHEVADVHHL